MRTSTETLDTHEQLCAEVEELLKGQLARRGGGIEECPENLGALVEETSAVITRLLARNSGTEQWLYFRVSVESQAEANLLLARHVAPALRELKGRHPFAGWWWLNKQDSLGKGVRLRIRVPSRRRKEVELAVREHLAAFDCQFSMLEYEPEVRLFGGAVGIGLAHEHFCADSEFLTDWMRLGDIAQPPVIPVGLSLALIFLTLRAAGLDLFECWDVFDRVRAKRRSPDNNDEIPPRIERLALKIINAGPGAVFGLYEGERGRLLKEHSAFIASYGQRLRTTYFEGNLECGLREYLAALIFFHWNRVGMTASVQSKLAHAVERELARQSREGATQRV